MVVGDCGYEQEFFLVGGPLGPTAMEDKGGCGRPWVREGVFPGRGLLGAGAEAVKKPKIALKAKVSASKKRK